jgi:mRNA-degrading endonuclease toxin of MazEF toxin-antitoxin module
VVIHDAGSTALVVAVTDARKKRLPTHALVRGFSSGTQVKDALVTCEHAWFLDPVRLQERPGAGALGPDERLAVGQCLRIALGLAPSRPPPEAPKWGRGSLLRVDFSGGVGRELTGEHPAVVLSNDAGNYFGRTLLVAPRLGPDDIAGAVILVALPSGPIDLGRLRVVDLERVRGSAGDALLPAEMASVESRVRDLLPWGS